jgi:hypothetical protein
MQSGLWAWVAALCAASAAMGAPSVVTIEKQGQGWALKRNGEAYAIKGAGGDGPLELLARCGGDSVRTWGAESAQATLDAAQKLGLSVTLGIWLGHPRHGFDYNNVDQVAKQLDEVRKAVTQFKDHPALLMWGLGNEMEGDGANAAIWSALEGIAATVKRLDPNHPTMTVVAELGSTKVAAIHKLCPSIDVLGINTYAGAVSVAERYAKAGGTKPYVLTEFGPPGTWEVEKTAWGAIIEPTSEAKAGWYRRAYTEAIVGKPLCLGSYAFTWGHKQEATTTWFGMLLADGCRVAAADVAQEVWSGKPPANRCPVIGSLKVSPSDALDPGASLSATLAASDPEGDKLAVEWVLQAEAGRYFTGGDAEAAPPVVAGALTRSSLTGADLKMPAEPGQYRLYATVRDGKGGAATANVPLLVRGERKVPPAATAALPLVVYDERDRKSAPYAPTGWMGNRTAVKMDEACTVKPFAGATCIRCEYTATADWAGVVWQSPPDDWGDQPGGWNLTGAKRLAFRVRGEKGGEVASFMFGVLGRDKKYFDSAEAKKADVKLTQEWTEVTIDLAGKDLSRIKTGFAWTVAGQGAPVVFYLDDIKYE